MSDPTPWVLAVAIGGSVLALCGSVLVALAHRPKPDPRGPPDLGKDAE
jgi:hypothetical protein